MSLAIGPDGQQLEVGGLDGVLALVDAETGEEQRVSLPVRAPAAAEEGKAGNPAKPGKKEAREERTVAAELEGKKLTEGLAVISTLAGLEGQGLEGGSSTRRKEQVALGGGAAAASVDRLAVVNEVERKDWPGSGQKIGVPASLVGALDGAGDVDD